MTTSGSPGIPLEWTRDASWPGVLAQCGDATRRSARRGLERFRRAIPPHFTHKLAQIRHPLILDYAFRGNRFELVEFIVAVDRFAPRRVKDRVRNPADYCGFRAEQLAGLALAATGATMEHEPLGSTGSPDWLATWPNGSELMVEVKCPLESKQSRTCERITMNFHSALQAEFAKSTTVRADTGTWITMGLTEDFVRDLAGRRIVHDDGTVNQRAFEELARAAMERIEGMHWPASDGVYAMAAAGVFRVRRGAGAEPKFHFGGNEIASDEEQEGLRVRTTLMEAAEQLGRDSRPGLVVLDTCCDSLLINRVQDIAESVDTEAWAAGLAGVLMLERRVDSTPDCRATFVPGARWESAEALLRGLRWCEHGDAHVCSGVFERPGCTGPWWRS